MANKKTIKIVNKKKVIVNKIVNKVKTPKVKLLTYEIKAIIPTGMYANIQPCIIVEADTLEHAERVVMPHIEALFAKYREGAAPTVHGVKPIVTVTPKPPVVPPSTVTIVAPPVAPTPVTPAIVMTVPFTRAQSAVMSCTSREALKLVSDQIEKSEKLVDTEKVALKEVVTTKFTELNA